MLPQVKFIGPAALQFPLQSEELAGCMPPSDERVAGSVPGMQYQTKVTGNVGCITLAEKDRLFTLALATASLSAPGLTIENWGTL